MPRNKQSWGDSQESTDMRTSVIDSHMIYSHNSFHTKKSTGPRGHPPGTLRSFSGSTLCSLSPQELAAPRLGEGLGRE